MGSGKSQRGIAAQLSQNREELADSLFQLGLLYSTGELGKSDYVAAHSWFNLAAMQGNEVAREYRSSLAIDLTPEEISRAQKLARDWTRAA